MELRRIEVELHARAGDLAGVRRALLELPPGATGADLKKALAEAHPGLEGLLRACAVATEREYLTDSGPLGEGARFHLIPPVSGG